MCDRRSQAVDLPPCGQRDSTRCPYACCCVASHRAFRHPGRHAVRCTAESRRAAVIGHTDMTAQHRHTHTRRARNVAHHKTAGTRTTHGDRRSQRVHLPSCCQSHTPLRPYPECRLALHRTRRCPHGSIGARTPKPRRAAVIRSPHRRAKHSNTDGRRRRRIADDDTART